MNDNQLARAHRAMRAAILRDQIHQRTNLTALIHRARGVPHDPACTSQPMSTPTWTKTAHDAIHPRRANDGN